MSKDNWRLDRYEELSSRIDELRRSASPDHKDVAVCCLLATINDQLASVKHQINVGELPRELSHEGMASLESAFLYGYLIGGATLIATLIGEEQGGDTTIDALRLAYGELYGEHGERNWIAGQSVSFEDPDYQAGALAGEEDLRRFVSRIQGKEMGPSNRIAAHIHERMTVDGD